MKLVKIDNSVSVCICVPCRDTLHSLFSYSLVKLVQYCDAFGIRTNLVMKTGSLIAEQRHSLAVNAIDNGYSHILWLDSDMMFPSHTLEKLLSFDAPVVACNYSTRTEPLKNVAYETIGDWDSWVRDSVNSPRVVSVEGVGMGCMLTRIDVFKNMSYPYFEVAYDSKLKEWIGEDFYFCKALREQNYEILIDMSLSRDIHHLGVLANTIVK